jgi:hypothetical protein
LYSVPDTRLHSNLHEHYMPKGALFTIYLVLTLAAPTRLAFPGKHHDPSPPWYASQYSKLAGARG